MGLMNVLSAFLCLTLMSMLLAGQEPDHDPCPDMGMAHAAALYSQARTILEDKTITDVASVPFLLESSAASGYASAELLLLDLWEGRYKGVDADYAKANELALKIADYPLTADCSLAQWDAQSEAIFRRALYLENGYGVEASPAEAFVWMARAAETGMPQAQCELARYYMKGLGVKQDYIKALRMLKALTKRAPKTPRLYFYLGYMCERGMGLSRPRRFWAAQLYQAGVLQGDAQATNNLGSLYERGLGLEKDVDAAMRFYRRAALQGDKDAAVNMQRLAWSTGDDATQDAIPEVPARLRLGRAALRLIDFMPVAPPLSDHIRRAVQRMEKELL